MPALHWINLAAKRKTDGIVLLPTMTNLFYYLSGINRKHEDVI